MVSDSDSGSSVVVTAQDVRTYAGPPLYLFLGISTAGSGVFRTFPQWAPIIAPGAVLRGVDLPETATRQEFRDLVLAMRDNPYVVGAVVTSHKLRLYAAITDLLDHADPLCALTHEISALDTGNAVVAHATDPRSLDIVLDTVGGPEWPRPCPVFCIGSGGAAIALVLAMGLDIPATLRTSHPVPRTPETHRGPLTIVGREEASLEEITRVRERAGIVDSPVTLVLAHSPDDVARALRGAPAGSVIANATGLGKLSPGSPLDAAQAFPQDVLAWDFNYRGPLTFLRQAEEAGVRTEDGWDYFVAGWAAGLAAVGGVDLSENVLNAMREASDAVRAGARP